MTQGKKTRVERKPKRLIDTMKGNFWVIVGKFNDKVVAVAGGGMQDQQDLSGVISLNASIPLAMYFLHFDTRTVTRVGGRGDMPIYSWDTVWKCCRQFPDFLSDEDFELCWPQETMVSA